MDPRRLRIALLIAATLLVDLWVVVPPHLLPALRPWWTHLTVVLLPALAFSQMNLVAVWTALSRRSVGWRFAGMIVWIIFWNLLVGKSRYPAFRGNDPGYTSLFLAQAVVVVSCLTIARALGLRLVDGRADLPVGPSAAGLNKLQFSLIDMLGYITATAALMSLIQLVFHFRSLPVSGYFVAAAFFAAIGYGAISLAAMWFALGNGPEVDRVAVLCLHMGPAILCLMPITMYMQGGGRAEWTPGVVLVSLAVCLLQMLFLVESLWVFRTVGYRLALSSRIGPRQAPAEGSSTR